MKLEVHEKIRSEIRATEILHDLWELDYVFYIIGIVRFQATFFMLQVFVFVQRIESYRLKQKHAHMEAGGQGWSALGLARLGPACFVFHTPHIPICTPFAYFIYFLYFLIFFMFIDFNIFSEHQKIMKNIFFIFCILFYFLSYFFA